MEQSSNPRVDELAYRLAKLKLSFPLVNGGLPVRILVQLVDDGGRDRGHVLSLCFAVSVARLSSFDGARFPATVAQQLGAKHAARLDERWLTT